MQIATGLIRLRDRAKLTQEEVGKTAGVSKATVSRYENTMNRSRIRWPVVRDLADACGAQPDERDTLVRLAKEAAQDGWWVGNDAVPGWLNPLLSLEHEAVYEHVFANALVPGLLQTREYAIALNRGQQVRSEPMAIEALADARIRRQALLTRTPPLHLGVVLDEAVITRIVGDRRVMADQLNHLCEQAQRPNVDIQVLPFSAGAHAAGNGHFVTLGGADESMRVVYIETLLGGLYFDKEHQVAPYPIAFDYLRAEAASTTASAKILARACKEFR